MTGVTIKAIIVDMGGVLLRTETQEPRRKLAARLGLSLEELYEIVFESQESKLLQLGEVSYEQAWDTLAQRFGLDQRGLAEVQHQMFATRVAQLERRAIGLGGAEGGHFFADCHFTHGSLLML